jgi:mono/diheme cytochrome c family protein
MTTTLRMVVVAVIAGLTGSLTAAPAQRTITITLPRETATYATSQLPGYALVQKNCVACHSADYAAMQPPASARAYWEATVRKMKKPFGAVFPEEDVAAMVDYLAQTYGAERPAAAPPR